MASQSSPDHSFLEPAGREPCPAGRRMSPPHPPGTEQEQGGWHSHPQHPHVSCPGRAALEPQPQHVMEGQSLHRARLSPNRHRLAGCLGSGQTTSVHISNELKLITSSSGWSRGCTEESKPQLPELPGLPVSAGGSTRVWRCTRGLCWAAQGLRLQVAPSSCARTGGCMQSRTYRHEHAGMHMLFSSQWFRSLFSLW